MTTTPIQRTPITDAIETHLRAIPNLTIYRGEVPDDPAPIPGDPDGRVKPYAVLYPMFGADEVEASLGRTNPDAEPGCQITCVGGYAKDAEFCADRVHAYMFHWSPTVSGLVVGWFEPPRGYDAGPARPDTSVKPVRFYVPLEYRARATR